VLTRSEERDAVVNELRKLELPNLNVTEEIQSIKKQWCNGKIDYFEYLMKLNKEAGRSFNDLMLYPVGPFVMADYTSQLIDLENISMYSSYISSSYVNLPVFADVSDYKTHNGGSQYR